MEHGGLVHGVTSRRAPARYRPGTPRAAVRGRGGGRPGVMLEQGGLTCCEYMGHNPRPRTKKESLKYYYPNFSSPSYKGGEIVE
eukprot:4287530-Prymnesium_polylepis.2